MFISVGGGISLILLAVVAMIMSNNPWVKLVSMLYLALCVIAILVGLITDGIDPWSITLLGMIVLVGMHAHGVHHMFDAKDKGGH